MHDTACILVAVPDFWWTTDNNPGHWSECKTQFWKRKLYRSWQLTANSHFPLSWSSSPAKWALISTRIVINQSINYLVISIAIVHNFFIGKLNIMLLYFFQCWLTNILKNSIILIHSFVLLKFKEFQISVFQVKDFFQYYQVCLKVNFHVLYFFFFFCWPRNWPFSAVSFYC